MLKNKQRKMIAAGSAAILAVSAAVSAAPQLSALTVGGDTSIVILGDSISSLNLVRDDDNLHVVFKLGTRLHDGL